MKPVQRIEQFLHFLTLLCILALPLTGCQNEEQNKGNDSAASEAFSHHTDTDNTENSIVLTDSIYDPVIDPANFSSGIDNPYFNLTPGKVWVYQGKNEDEEVERVEVEVTQETKTILGIVATVVRERCWENGELVEDTFDWYAQDRAGNVWYLGEDSKDIEEGQVVSTDGSWEAGVNGAKPGIVMKGNPQVGDAYRQEYLKGEAEDMGQVLSVEERVSIGLGSYEHSLQTKDWTPLEPEVVEHKFYSKEVGNVILEKKITGAPGQIELIEFRAK